MLSPTSTEWLLLPLKSTRIVGATVLWLSQRITLDLKPFIVLQITLQPAYTCATEVLSLIIEIAFVKINEQCIFPRCSGFKICWPRSCRGLVNSTSLFVPLSLSL